MQINLFRSFGRQVIRLALVVLLGLGVHRGAQAAAAANPSSGKAAAASAGGSGAGGGSSSAAFESQMLAAGGVNHVAQALAKRVCALDGINRKNSVVLIYDQPAFAALQSYEAFLANIGVMKAAYRTLIPGTNLDADLKKLYSDRAETYKQKAPATSLDFFVGQKWLSASITLSTDPVADLTGLLSTIAVASNTETPGQIAFPDSTMALALTKEVNTDCTEKPSVVYPPLFGKSSASDFASADIQVEIQKLNDLRMKAVQAVDEANDAALTASTSQVTTSREIDTTKPAADATKAKDGSGGSITTKNTDATSKGATTATGDMVLAAALTDINGLYDSFMNSLLQVNAGTGVIGSASVIQGYQLAQLLRGVACLDKDKSVRTGTCPTTAPSKDGDVYADWVQRPAFVVLASFVSAGGTTEDHKTFWTSLWKGDKISYSGGVIVNVAVWQADASTPIYSDVLRYRTPFLRIKDPARVDGVDAGDNVH